MGDHAEDYAKPWGERRIEAFDHHASSMLIVCVVAAVWFGLKTPDYPVPETPVLMLLFITPLLVLLLAVISWMRMRIHDRSLCEHCAAAIPLNPKAKVKRQRLRFVLAHKAAEPRFLVPYLALLIGSNFVMDQPARTGWAIVQLTMIYLIMAHVSHRRLQPWCPECSQHGGGAAAGASH